MKPIEEEEIVDLAEEVAEAIPDSSIPLISINDLEISPLVIEEEPLTKNAESLFATKKDVFGLNIKLNTVLMNSDISHQKKLDDEMKSHQESVLNLKDRTKEMFVAVDKSVQLLVGEFQGVESKLQMPAIIISPLS